MRYLPTAFLLLVWAPTATLALAQHNRPQKKIVSTSKNTGARGQVSLKYQDAIQERVYLSDSAFRKVALNIQPFQFPREATTTSTSKEPQQVLATKKQPTRRTAVPPPSEKTLETLGYMLAVNSGFLNGLALSGIMGQTMGVAAVTGAWTGSALNLASGTLPVLQLSVIGAYFAGSLVNGLLHPEGISWKSNKPCTTRTLLGVASLVLAASSLSSLPLLAVAIGWQNSWSSMLLQGNLLRTAHFSGITSDVGTKVGQMVRLGKKGMSADLIHKLVVQSRLLGSFVVGGVLSFACKSVFGSTKIGLIASAALLAGSYVGLKLRHVSVRQAFRRTVRPVMLPAPLL